MGVLDGLMDSLWGSLKRGETVLIERTDSGDQYFGVYHLIRWGTEEGYTVLVVDILDSFHLLRAKARLAGMDDPILDNVKAIKVGGRIKTGDVVGWIKDISEPVILMEKFKESYGRVLNSENPVLTVVIGLEKLFITSGFSPKNTSALIMAMSGYVGDERRLGVYFLKTKVLQDTGKPIVGLLEDIATTVIGMSKKDKIVEFHVVKSTNRELEGCFLSSNYHNI